MVCFWVPPNLFMVNFECSVHFFRCSYILQLNITNWLTFAFKTLLTKSKHNSTTVIAPYQFIVRMDNKTMCHIYFDYTIILRIRNIKNLKKSWKKKLKKTRTLSYFFCLFCSGTLIHDDIMASLVNHASTNLALVTLFTKAPNEFIAMWTENRLSEIGSHEFMTFDLVNICFYSLPTLVFHTTVLFCELLDWLFLFLFTGPCQLNSNLDLTIRFQGDLKSI